MYGAKGCRVRQTTYDGSSGNWIVIEDLKFISDAMSVGRHLRELNGGNQALERRQSRVFTSQQSRLCGGVCGLL